MQGKKGDRTTPLRQYPTELAILPTAQDGIARALRDAFKPAEKDVPADWRGLLDRLN